MCLSQGGRGGAQGVHELKRESRADGSLFARNTNGRRIAVGVDEGMVVPIVRDADRKSFAERAKDTERLPARPTTTP